jgi:hypothetical protein
MKKTRLVGSPCRVPGARAQLARPRRTEQMTDLYAAAARREGRPLSRTRPCSNDGVSGIGATPRTHTRRRDEFDVADVSEVKHASNDCQRACPIRWLGEREISRAARNAGGPAAGELGRVHEACWAIYVMGRLVVLSPFASCLSLTHRRVYGLRGGRERREGREGREGGGEQARARRPTPLGP